MVNQRLEVGYYIDFDIQFPFEKIIMGKEYQSAQHQNLKSAFDLS
jgi:hypothetical protein